MKLFCITYRGKIVNLRQLMLLYSNWGNYIKNEVLTLPVIGDSAKQAKETFLEYVGFTWGERPKGVEVEQLQIMKE